MKQILIISGKGGTGKTVLAGAFACLSESKVMVDSDVDAANLYLLLNPVVIEEHEFRSGKTAIINKDICIKCGQCLSVCRFGAIKKDFTIESFSCEGCALCSFICPCKAIDMEENISGHWFVSETKYGLFVHAKLGIAEENSGKLVAKIRQEAKALAEKTKVDYVIIDGPPGIGCPVMASMSGIDLAVVVTEPTLAGLHDAKRVIETARHFNVKTTLVINKYDLNLDVTKEIEKYCKDIGVPVIGKIDFDENVVKAMVIGKNIVEYVDNKTTQEIKQIWKILKEEI